MLTTPTQNSKKTENAEKSPQCPVTHIYFPENVDHARLSVILKLLAISYYYPLKGIIVGEKWTDQWIFDPHLGRWQRVILIPATEQVCFYIIKNDIRFGPTPVLARNVTASSGVKSQLLHFDIAILDGVGVADPIKITNREESRQGGKPNQLEHGIYRTTVGYQMFTIISPLDYANDPPEDFRFTNDADLYRGIEEITGLRNLVSVDQFFIESSLWQFALLSEAVQSSFGSILTKGQRILHHDSVSWGKGIGDVDSSRFFVNYINNVITY